MTEARKRVHAASAFAHTSARRINDIMHVLALAGVHNSQGDAEKARACLAEGQPPAVEPARGVRPGARPQAPAAEALMPFTAHCFFRQGSPYNGHRRQPSPPFAAVAMLLEQLDATLRGAGMVPVAVRCQSWPVPPRDDGTTVMAQIAIEAAPGAMHAPLRQWFQWQHAQWQWAREPIPTVEASMPALAAAAMVPHQGEAK